MANVNLQKITFVRKYCNKAYNILFKEFWFTKYFSFHLCHIITTVFGIWNYCAMAGKSSNIFAPNDKNKQINNHYSAAYSLVFYILYITTTTQKNIAVLHKHFLSYNVAL